MLEARVLVVENVLSGIRRFGRTSIRTITGSRKTIRRVRASQKEAAIR
jgi:hypothetical protein